MGTESGQSTASACAVRRGGVRGFVLGAAPQEEPARREAQQRSRRGTHGLSDVLYGALVLSGTHGQWHAIDFAKFNFLLMSKIKSNQ